MTRLLPCTALLLFLVTLSADALAQTGESVTATITLEETLPSFPDNNNLEFRPTPQGPALYAFPNNNNFDFRPQPVSVDTTGGKKRLRFTVPWPEGEVKVDVTKTRGGTYSGSCTQGKVTVPCMMAFPNNNNLDP